MNFETLLYYVTHHSEAIIQWLFLAILLLAGLVVARGLFAKKAPSEGLAVADSSEMQEFLQKILDRTAKLDAVATSNLTPATAAQVDEQIQILKKDLSVRDAEIQKLKAAGSSQSSEDAGKIDARIKELEAKLAEYEILEDDIADLSLFKEENSRLKLELEKVKGTPAAAAPPIAAAKPATTTPSLVEPLSVAPISGDEIVAEFAEAVTQETTESTAAPLQAPDTGDSMADFESAMKLDKKISGGANLDALASPAASPPSAEVAESDDLFAEFANPTPLQEDLDTNKLVAEMDALAGIDATSVDKNLEEAIDTEKLVLEANFGKS